MGELNHGVATPLFWVRSSGRLCAGLHVGNNTMNTRRCIELFVTQGLRPRKANASAKHVKALHVDVATPRFRVSFAALPCSSEWRVKNHQFITPHSSLAHAILLINAREAYRVKSLHRRRFCVGPLLDRYL